MRRAAKIDSTAKALTGYARSIGFTVLTINGVVDAVLALGQTAVVVDWKSKGGSLTEAQAKLVASGFPIRFISNGDQLQALRSEILGRER